MDLSAHHGTYTVLAAGGVVRRAGRAGKEIAVVHRPRYDDWSLPKGKLEPGESAEAGALREVEWPGAARGSRMLLHMRSTAASFLRGLRA